MNLVSGFLVDLVAFVILIALALNFSNIVFIAIYPYTNETYETQVRTTGTSMNAMIARFTGIIMPTIIV